MFNEDFAHRLSQLRAGMGVSARDMSLSIGQNAGYINSIENKKSLPSMTVFLSICDYLGIAPSEFFDVDSKHPAKLRGVIENLKKLDERQFCSIASIIADLAS